MSKTDAVETDILKLFTGKATTIFATTPITPFIALYTAAPTESTSGTEVSGSSYARQSVVAASWTISGTAPTQAANNVAVTFPIVTTTGYTVLGAALCDAVSAGNILRFGTTTSTAIIVGDQGNFPTTTLIFTED